MEEWKKINNELLEDRYYVSNKGKVKDNITGFTYIYKSNQHNGYIGLSLKCKDGKRRKFLLHRLVAETYIDNPHNYPVINHINENKQDNCIENLEWCTQKDNMIAWIRKRHPVKKGE